MKQMEYGKDLDGGSEVLYHGTIDGFECVIVNIKGSHPCAYINVPKSVLDKYEKPELDDERWFADCHGGFTYASEESPCNVSNEVGFWLGWDYAHWGDYTCVAVNGKVIIPPKPDEKLWTTAEVLENVVDTIHSLEYCTE